MDYEKAPMEIENQSFTIIADEMKRSFDRATDLIIRRIIHATGDFEYEDITEFYNDAVARGLKAMEAGPVIYTDTRMALVGINKRVLSRLGGRVVCLVDDPSVAEEAQRRKVTRSIVGMERACADQETSVFVIGNAPTALLTLETQVRKDNVRPDLVIGVPVGFVSAAESKESFCDCGVPYITTRGRKGGTTVAVATINALLYMIDNKRQ